jgi:DNA-directed RNA polymerase subunit RPC12/RpoP
MTILHEGYHTAKKSHRCAQCGHRIEVGERYRKQVYTEDGLVTYKAHIDCDDVAEEMRSLAGSAWNYDEDAYPISETACERNDGWIKEKFPEVARRLWGFMPGAEG